MTSLIVLASVVLLIIVAVQIGKISELTAGIRGEEAAQRDSDNFNAKMGLYFLVAFLVFCVGSAWYYKDYMLGYGLKHASIHGEKIQGIFDITLFFTGIVFVVTHIALFWYAYKYKAEKGRKVLFIADDHKLERIWTAIPALVMCGLVIFGLSAWNDAMSDVKPGDDYVEIEATAYQFGWDIRYTGKDKIIGEKNFRNITPGVNDIGINFNDPASHDDFFIGDEIVLPKGKKTRVRITSKDVLHNFGAPHFSVKMDAIPGLPTYFVFTPTMTTEEYRLFLKKNPAYDVPSDPEDPSSPKKWETFDYELACMELCGKGHFSMRKKIKIVSPEEYEKWLEGKKSFFEENVKGKLEGKYTWYKGEAVAKPAAEFSAAAVENAKAGDVLNLNHVTFATGSANLTAQSSQELDLVVDIMTKNPNMKVEVSGHTDNVGDAVKNQALSESRAKAVVDYVAKKGIDASRMTGLGFGDTRPVADNATPEGKQQNRRTEFKILVK